MKNIINKLISPLGLRLIKKSDSELLYQHNYFGGYEHYRDVQIFHNKRKINKVWADETTLSIVAEDILKHNLVTAGVCHGARNGYEVEWLRKKLACDVIGTDISETASKFQHMHVWDFHDENSEWMNKFDFIYTNSLDQAMDPKRAMASWTGQLTTFGRIYIEHTMAHSPQGAGEMDPFGAHPMIMPYLFFTWGRGHYQLVDIFELPEKKNNKLKVWIFVLEKIKLTTV